MPNIECKVDFISEMHQQIVPPDFTKNLKSVDVLEDAPFAFECHVTGIPLPTISWNKDDMNIDNSPEYVITKINGTCCLKIRKIGRHHSARYTCRAVNPGGEAASSARLNVVRKTLFYFKHDVVRHAYCRFVLMTQAFFDTLLSKLT